MAALKEIYSKEFLANLIIEFSKASPKLNEDQFYKDIIAKPWKQLELKQRIRRISDVILKYLPADFDDKIKIIRKFINNLNKDGIEDFNFPHIYLPEIIQKSGIEHFEESMKALEFITIFTSAEFAIRHFYLVEFDSTLKQMIKWSKHPHPMVRRLASEGSRPLLPWGIGIPKIKQNPEVHLPILENLWNDKNEIVRRSVSNHLNDISKLKEELTWNFVKDKLGESEKTDKDLRHALRTLLKKGNKKALSAFSYQTTWIPKSAEMKLHSNKVRVGERLHFMIRIQNGNSKSVKLRLEYKISFLLANGKSFKKVFQLGEVLLEPMVIFEKSKSHSFVPITTRTYYPGKHSVCLVINGTEYDSKDFSLVE